MPKYLELAMDQRAVLPVLWHDRWDRPHMDDTTYLLELVAEGWCLSPACIFPPGHCHVPRCPVAAQLDRLLKGSEL